MSERCLFVDMWFLSGCRKTVSRDRVNRRVVADEFEQLESKLKLSKIPLGFVSFDNISQLPPRQLAYTAHIAARAGMENEDLWKRLREAFLESLQFRCMKPKYLTQLVIPLVSRGLDAHAIDSVMATVATRASEFRTIDIVLILHAIGADVGDAASVRKIADDLAARQDLELTPKSLAVLFACIGKAGVRNAELSRKLLALAIRDKELFHEHEIAAIARALPKIASQADASAIQSFLSGCSLTQLDPGCCSIVVHALAELEAELKISVKREVKNIVLKTISSTPMLGDPSLLPSMLLSCARLADSIDDRTLCLRIASHVTRHYKKLKAASLPVALRGVEILAKKFPLDRDIAVVESDLRHITETAIDQLILLSRADERRALLESKYVRYSPWFARRLIESLVGAAESELNRDVNVRLVENTPEEAIKQLWSDPHREDLDELLTTVLKAKSPQSGLTYSLLFRYVIRNPDLEGLDNIVAEFEKDMHACDVKTIARMLQLVGGDAASPFLMEVVRRFSEVDGKDLLGFLRLFAKHKVQFDIMESAFSQYSDAIEAKIAVELGLVKSFSRKEQIVASAKSIGLTGPEDVMEAYEKSLALELRNRLSLKHEDA